MKVHLAFWLLELKALKQLRNEKESKELKDAQLRDVPV